MVAQVLEELVTDRDVTAVLERYFIKRQAVSAVMERTNVNDYTLAVAAPRSGVIKLSGVTLISQELLVANRLVAPGDAMLKSCNVTLMDAGRVREMQCRVIEGLLGSELRLYSATTGDEFLVLSGDGWLTSMQVTASETFHITSWRHIVKVNIGTSLHVTASQLPLIYTVD